jgi:hypothetical protein
MMMGVLVGLGRSRLGLGLRVRTLGLKRLVSALYDTVEHLHYSSRRGLGVCLGGFGRLSWGMRDESASGGISS